MAIRPPFTGHCLCGQITFEVDSEPIVVSCCHCSNCKKYTGTVFTTYVVFPAGTLRVTVGENLITTYRDETQDSGNAIPRHFCSNCGSPLFNTNCDFGRTTSVFYSALEGFEHRRPEIENYAKDRVGWLPEFLGTQKADTRLGRK